MKDARRVRDTTGRLLAVLSVLQDGGAASGPELADRLGVTVRTIRRDVERLRDLGYPIDSDAGVAGGYRFGISGTRVPPLMLDDEEAVALAVCVRSTAADDLDALVLHLGILGVPFRILEPLELAARVHHLAARLAEQAALTKA